MFLGVIEKVSDASENFSIFLFAPVKFYEFSGANTPKY